MTTASTFSIAAGTVAESLRAIDRLDPAAPTPCQDWDAAALINHFTGTAGALGRIGWGHPLDPDHPWGQGDHAAAGDWSGRLAEAVDGLGTAWSRPDAWHGSVSFGGSEMTAEAVGQMAFAEALLHGWDLTRTAGQPLTVPDEIGAELLRLVAVTAELGRTMGAYGPEVPVAGDRPTFDRALGLAGRDPDWAG
ncbi:TIGR03086 family metal-binding protein [Microlunatus speluncae]|uniref:TIGR03086 family metal-binding protein n=1 Tax=Microlunatus speluncae TaxID=2594267 RepID=UPI0012667B1E|nr:TIGR03086 family metal-binding protein [Microlunatus speluncae]